MKIDVGDQRRMKMYAQAAQAKAFVSASQLSIPVYRRVVALTLIEEATLDGQIAWGFYERDAGDHRDHFTGDLAIPVESSNTAHFDARAALSSKLSGLLVDFYRAQSERCVA